MRAPCALMFQAVLAAMTLPEALAGQAAETCIVHLDRVGGQGRRMELSPSRVRQYAGGGVLAHCVGQPTSMKSDSVAWYSELARFDMDGNVSFTDSVVQLDSKRATYYLSDEHLESTGRVRLENLETGSVLTGPLLYYYRAVDGIRDTSELFAPKRSRVEYRSETGDRDAEPYLIDGDRLRLKGNDRAWAGGDVVIDRSDFHATADSAVLELSRSHGELIGRAVIVGSDTVGYELHGSTIEFGLAGDKIDWVEAQRDANASGSDWLLIADSIRFQMADDMIQSGIAWGDTTRPRAVSTEYRIVADSIAIDTPGQQLKEVRGFGRAVARALPDSGKAATDTTLLGNDWIAGDTVIARFDITEDGNRYLRELEALGSAQAFYRVYDSAKPEGPPALNYSRGDRIVASFGPEGVERVDVMGGADGIHLEPKRGKAGDE